VFIILKQRIDSIKVETDGSIHNEEDVIGMETDGVCVPEECEPEVSHILRWFLLWWLLVYIVVCGFVHMELLRLVDVQCCLCVWSFGSVTILRADSVLVLQYL
jgi:hypothetical protein